MGSTITHIWVQVYDYRYMITGIWLQVYDYRYMIADIWFQKYDMMTDIWLQTYDTHIWLSSKTLCLHTYDHIPPYMVFTYMILVHVYGTHICVCRHMIHIYVYLFPWDAAATPPSGAWPRFRFPWASVIRASPTPKNRTRGQYWPPPESDPGKCRVVNLPGFQTRFRNFCFHLKN